MSFTASGLKDSITVKVTALSDEDRGDKTKAYEAWITGIQEYIFEELSLSGDYLGVTTTVPPVVDPESGPYRWGMTAFILESSVLEAVVQDAVDPVIAFNAWKDGLETALSTIIFVGVDKGRGVVTTVPGLLFTDFVLSLEQEDIVGAANVYEAIEIIANKLYDSIMDMVVAGVTSAATSNTPGTGSVIYTELS